MQSKYGLATIACKSVVDGIGIVTLTGVLTPTAAPDLRRDIVVWARQERVGALLLDARRLCLGVCPARMRQQSEPSVELEAPVAFLVRREFVAPWRAYCESRARDALVRGAFTELGLALDWTREEALVHRQLRRSVSAPAGI